MNISCDVILDLIPLVKDGVASNDSATLVKEHLNSCESCKAELETFECSNVDVLPIEDKKIIFAMKRSIYITQIIILMVGAIVGVALSNSMGMFYNFIIMPIIGGISLTALKRKWYLAPLIIFLFTYLWQTMAAIVLEGFSWSDLYIGLYYSSIYATLIGLGVVITMLLKFTFKKER